MRALTRRDFLGASVLGAGAAVFGAGATAAFAEEATKVVVHRSATCGCCKAWAGKLRAAGFVVEVIDEPDMKAVKARLGVPQPLGSCHTAEVAGYVIEGHVPVVSVQKLLAEKPKATGLAVPGMPMGSPGMDMGEQKDVYEVVLFGPSGQSVYGKFEGDKAI